MGGGAAFLVMPTKPIRRMAVNATACTRHPSRPFRELNSTTFPAYLPQTIEYAVVEAQRCMAEALRDEHRRIIVELPMGRSRKYWYRFSPRDMWLRESTTLAPHLAEALSGADIRIIVGNASRLPRLSWVSSFCTLSQVTVDPQDFLTNISETTIVFIVGLVHKQQLHLHQLIQQIPESVPIILMNCMMELPYAPSPFPKGFTPVYMCRALKGCAFARYGHHAPWHLFVEIAVFEYEWIRDIQFSDQPDAWVPVQSAIETAALRRGALVKAPHTHYKSPHKGCEAGFWPFMTITFQQTLPLDGVAMHDEARDAAKRRKRKSSGSKPFGFF